MSTTALMAVDDYLRLTGKPHCEYRDGAVSPKAMPTKSHALIQYALLMLLRDQGVLPLPELTVRLSPTRYLAPDVSVPGDFAGPYATEPVLLCCEILSAEDRLGMMLAKCEEYHAWGVPYCWVIDPVKRTAWEYHSGLEPERAAADLRAGTLSVKLRELFASLDGAL